MAFCEVWGEGEFLKVNSVDGHHGTDAGAVHVESVHCESSPRSGSRGKQDLLSAEAASLSALPGGADPTCSACRGDTGRADGVQDGVMFGPLYKRRYFSSAETDATAEGQQKRMRAVAPGASLYEFPFDVASQHLSEPVGSDIVDVETDIMRPLWMSLALIFAHLHGIPSHVHKEEEAERDSRLLAQPPSRPSEKDRRSAVVHYSNIFNAMYNRLANKQVKRSIVASPLYASYSASHAMLDLYAFLWYSPAIMSSHPESTPGHRALRGASFTEELAQQDDGAMTELAGRAISKVKIFLVLWYIKHARPIPPQRSTAHIVRALGIFDFTSSDSTPALIFEETANHLVRLLLLCNLDEFFHMLALFSDKGDPVARLLQESLVEARLAKTSSRFRLNLFNEETHETFLVSLRLAVRGVRSSIRSANGSEELLNKSVFCRCFDLLCGEEAAIDRVVHQVFPNCWLSSFTLGVFWRSLKTNKIVTEMLRVLPNGIQEIGDIVAFFFNSWLDGHVSLKSLRQLKPTEVPLAALLANDIDQFVEFLRAHPSYPGAPILIDLITLDHPFSHSTRISCEVFFRQTMVEHMPSQVSSLYFFRGLLEARRDLLKTPLVMVTAMPRPASHAKNGVSEMKPNVVQRRSRYSFYALVDNDEPETTATTREVFVDGAGKPVSALESSNEDNFSTTLRHFLDGCSEECHNALASCYASNGVWAALAHLLWKLRLSDSYATHRYVCDLLDAFLSGQPASTIVWVMSQVAGITEGLARQFAQRKGSAWEGLLMVFFSLTLRSDNRLLADRRLQNNSPDVPRRFQTNYQQSFVGHGMDISNPFPARPNLGPPRRGASAPRAADDCYHLTDDQFDDGDDDVSDVSDEAQDTPFLVSGWRHELRALQSDSSYSHMSAQDNEENVRIIGDILDLCHIRSTDAVFGVPECCMIPETYSAIACEQLENARIRCPRLVFLVLATVWNAEFMTIQKVALSIKGSEDTSLAFSPEEVTRCQGAMYWLLKCLFEKYIPVAYFDATMDVIVAALNIDTRKASPKPCTGCSQKGPKLLSVHQLQQFSAFWTAYTSKMLDDELPVPETSRWSPSQAQNHKELNQLLTDAQLKRADIVCSERHHSVGVWDNWIQSHFSKNSLM